MIKFDKIKKLKIHSKNDLFIGWKDDKKFFIKKYIIRKGREKDDWLKVKCEIKCYKKLKAFTLPDYIDSNYDERYLILDFVNFRDIKIDKKEIAKMVNFHSTKISKADSSFLPKVKYDYYAESLFKRAKELADNGVIKDLNKIFVKFKRNKKLIEKSAIYFSHGDFHLGNFVYLDGKFTITDFEHARKDNLMYDLACIYVDLYHRKNLRDFFLKEIKRKKIFNNELFELMVLRRSIEILYVVKGKPQKTYHKNAKALLNEH